MNKCTACGKPCQEEGQEICGYCCFWEHPSEHIEFLERELDGCRTAMVMLEEVCDSLSKDRLRVVKEREDARKAARRLLTVMADGDAKCIARGIEEYPWLEEE